MLDRQLPSQQSSMSQLRKFIARKALLLLCMIYSAQLTTAQAAQLQGYLLLEFLDPAAGHQEQFHKWWPAHLKAMLTIPGCRYADSWERTSAKLKRPSAATLPAYLAVYFLQSSDASALERSLKSVTRVPPVANATSIRILLYRHTGTWTSSAPQAVGTAFRQLVFGNALPGRDADFNRWYDETHARDLITVPGVTSVMRFVFIDDIAGKGDIPPRYLSMMDFKTRSVDEFSEGLDAAGAKFLNTDAFDSSRVWRLLYQRVSASEPASSPMFP
jgi:hypothetical protein